jgi:hypothetical protein
LLPWFLPLPFCFFVLFFFFLLPVLPIKVPWGLKYRCLLHKCNQHLSCSSHTHTHTTVGTTRTLECHNVMLCTSLVPLLLLTVVVVASFLWV